MTQRNPSLFTLIAGCFLVLITGLAAAQSSTARSGDWLATLETPGGDLRLLINVSMDADGRQVATLESLDQAPGQLIPVSTISLTQARFEFSIETIGARFVGDWNAETDSYDGVFTQGMQFPTSFARPSERAVHMIEGLDGRWEGQLVRSDTTLDFALNIQTSHNGTRATLDSISQAAYDIPITNLDRSDHEVSFQIPAANVTFEGVLDDDRMQGRWSRPGFDTVTVTFERVAETVTTPNRPQLPQAPFPYDVEEVRVENLMADGVTLAGTLTLPAGAGPFPGVVLISGSGPQDRDETVWTHKPFAVLADNLTRQGIAVLRYDDRGYGESTGDFASATSFDFASDAQSVASFMRAHPAISEVGLAGHSEGGLIAPIVAVQDADTAFIVLIAGPGTPGHQFVVDQSIANMQAMGEDDAVITSRINALRDLIEIARNAGTQTAAMEALDASLTSETMALLQIPADQKGAFLNAMARDWYRTLVNYDPADWLPAMEQPVLALQGSLDLQIVAEPNVAGLEALLANHPDAEIIVLEGRNHLFQRAQTGLMTEYAQIEETMDPEAMTIIASWINTRFGAAN